MWRILAGPAILCFLVSAQAQENVPLKPGTGLETVEDQLLEQRAPVVLGLGALAHAVLVAGLVVAVRRADAAAQAVTS